MAGVSDNAICLRRWDFSETSQTVALLCREHGLVRGLAKGAKRPKSRFSGGFDILTRGQLVFSTRGKTGLATLMEWHLDCVHHAPRTDMHANRAAVFMVDLVMHGLDEADPHPAVFDAMATALETMDQQERQAISPAGALLWFQLRFMQDIGYRPQLDADSNTGTSLETAHIYAFSPSAGGLLADSAQQGLWRVRAETVDLLRAAQGAPEPIPCHPLACARANRLLGLWAREVLGHPLPTFGWAFPDDDLRRPAHSTEP